MTIENSEVVDGAGIDKETGEIMLTISDHLLWDNEPAHCRLIEKKIGRYLDFLRSGQIWEQFPQAVRGVVRINLIYKCPPSASGREFLSAAQRQLETEGIRFSYGPLPFDY